MTDDELLNAILQIAIDSHPDDLNAQVDLRIAVMNLVSRILADEKRRAQEMIEKIRA